MLCYCCHTPMLSYTETKKKRTSSWDFFLNEISQGTNLSQLSVGPLKRLSEGPGSSGLQPQTRGILTQCVCLAAFVYIKQQTTFHYASPSGFLCYFFSHRAGPGGGGRERKTQKHIYSRHTLCVCVCVCVCGWVCVCVSCAAVTGCRLMDCIQTSYVLLDKKKLPRHFRKVYIRVNFFSCAIWPQ